MSRIKTSWELFKRSLQVVLANRKLLIFPMVIGFFIVVIALFFIAPVVLVGGGSLTTAAHWKAVANTWGTFDAPGGHWRANPAGYALLAFIYLVSMFLSTFFNVAFFNEILNALNGRPVSIRGGLRFAVTRLRAILAWSLFSGLIGLAIKALEERVGFIGRWIVRLIGLAWSVASIFAIPMIVREEGHANPVLFLKSSAALLRKTWGESLIGFAGVAIGGVLGLAALGATILPALALSIVLDNYWLLALGVALGLLLLFVLGFLLGVVNQVYRGALFIYATEGVIPGPFDQAMMEMAWKLKSGRKER